MRIGRMENDSFLICNWLIMDVFAEFFYKLKNEVKFT